MWTDRWTVFGAMSALLILSWVHVFQGAQAGSASHSVLTTPQGANWGISDFQVAVLMWVLMMLGMMLPSVFPWIWTLSGMGKNEESAAGRSFAFLGGYLSIWIGYSVLAASLQWLLHDLALIPLGGHSIGSFPAGGLLLMVGLYQWSPVRLVCLKHCRSPLSYFLTFWKPGLYGAYRMGLHHGLFCVGCCWALMLVSFAAGVMNLLWMLAVTLFVLLEHCLSDRAWPGRVAGSFLAAAGLWLLVQG